MIKTMLAKYKGKDSRTGAVINPGDEIQYDTVTKKSWINERSDERPFYSQPKGTSDYFSIGGKEYYRNRNGRCEDAPCCGCCTI